MITGGAVSQWCSSSTSRATPPASFPRLRPGGRHVRRARAQLPLSAAQDRRLAEQLLPARQTGRGSTLRFGGLPGVAVLLDDAVGDLEDGLLVLGCGLA